MASDSPFHLKIRFYFLATYLDDKCIKQQVGVINNLTNPLVVSQIYYITDILFNMQTRENVQTSAALSTYLKHSTKRLCIKLIVIAFQNNFANDLLLYDIEGK